MNSDELVVSRRCTLGDRLVGALIGVAIGIIPGLLVLFVAAAVTDNFEDQSGIIVGLIGMLLVVMGAIAGAVAGAIHMPPTRGQAIAGIVLGVLPGLALWRIVDEVNIVVLVLLIIGPLWLGVLGWRADHRNRPRPLLH